VSTKQRARHQVITAHHQNSYCDYKLVLSAIVLKTRSYICTFCSTTEVTMPCTANIGSFQRCRAHLQLCTHRILSIPAVSCAALSSRSSIPCVGLNFVPVSERRHAQSPGQVKGRCVVAKAIFQNFSEDSLRIVMRAQQEAKYMGFYEVDKSIVADCCAFTIFCAFIE
jgi:hypothetical protein